eukprot:CAMPEP_0114550814 /NCGR_PEP_ID=MMETSP0114-20121206/6270_1 /TAXON_ID=31324 /ORGANISM="Goniomonas sp, Strain m" /LENGTH=781 /DNA_ID=CAMNT_0001735605 /DNA_START=283 /DNA_END=2628 /DNA_ORIENTATION=+
MVLTLKFEGETVYPVRCSARDCNFCSSSEVTCNEGECTCPTCPEEVVGLIASFDAPFEVQCRNIAGAGPLASDGVTRYKSDCAIRGDKWPMVVEAFCLGADCVGPSQTLGCPSDRSLSGDDFAGIIVAAGLVAAILCCVLLGAISQRRASRKPAPSPVNAVDLHFESLSYAVDTAHSCLRKSPSTTKQVLRDCSSHMVRNQLVAVMGPTGSGKTSLVDILAGRKSTGSVTGTVTINGTATRDSWRQKQIGYVLQDDCFVATLTVWETLEIAARLRLSEAISETELLSRVSQVLEDLGLSDVRNTRVGDSENRGLSGGERKRLSIAIELLTAPSVILLDEPTSGLDSNMALRVVETLANLARQGRIVVLSIHQPSAQLFFMFDKVLLMSRGRIVYDGPASEQGCSLFLSDRNHPARPGHNIADELLDAVSAPSASLSLVTVPVPLLAHAELPYPVSPEAPGREKPSDLSPGKPDGLPAFIELGPMPPRPGVRELEQESSDYATVLYTQFVQLLRRETIHTSRRRELLVGHWVGSVLVGLFIGLAFLDLDYTLEGFQNRLGAMFFILAVLGFSSISAVHSLAQHNVTFLRERGAHVYHPVAYYCAKMITDLVPLRVVPTIFISLLSYFMLGLQREALRFFRFLITLVLTSVACSSMTFAVTFLTRSPGLGTLVCSMLLLGMLLFSGLLLNSEAMHPFWQALSYLSFFHYGLEVLVANELQHSKYVFSPKGFNLDLPLQGETLANQFGMYPDNINRNMWILLGFIVFCNIVAALSLQLFAKERR